MDHPAIAEYPSGQTWLLKTEGQGADRLADLSNKIALLAEEHAPDDLVAVFIERVTGRFASPALAMASGVIQATLVHRLRQKYPHPCSVFELSPGTWKASAIGHGHAKKSDYIAWAVDRVGRDLTEDEAAALGIACAGANLLEAGAAIAD